MNNFYLKKNYIVVLVPMFLCYILIFLFSECNIDRLNAIRNEFKSNGIKISVNDLVIKAAATALQLVPEVNLNTGMNMILV